MKNIFASATPEQKLAILTNELLTPIESIRGFAFIIKKGIESNNINQEEILEAINIIAEQADMMKVLRDQAVG